MWSAFLDIHQGETTSEQNLTYVIPTRKRTVNTTASRLDVASENILLLRPVPGVSLPQNLMPAIR
jgi:hypothetical protein